MFRGLKKRAWKQIETLEWKLKRNVAPVPSEMVRSLAQEEGKQNQVKMIWVAPSSCAKDLTISEGTGATFLFNFHSRVSICFHALFLRPRNMRTNYFS